MDRRSTDDWFPALLTAGSFLATISMCVLALLDGLGGSASCACESVLAMLCGASFASSFVRPGVDEFSPWR